MAIKNELHNTSILFIDHLYPKLFQDINSVYGVKPDTISETHDRSLSVTAECVICSSLSYCQILNGYMVQEIYFPHNLAFRGTCHVIEDFGERISSEVFGDGRSFRDTPECRGNSCNCCQYGLANMIL